MFFVCVYGDINWSGCIVGEYPLQKVNKASKLAGQIIEWDLYAVVVVFALIYIQ